MGRNKAQVARSVVFLLLILAFFSTALSSVLVQHATAGSLVLSGNLSDMALDPIRQRLYVLDYDAGAVVVLSTTSDQVITRIPVGSAPTGADVSQDGSQLYITVRGTSQLAILNLETLTFSTPVNLTATPNKVAAGRQGRAYVTPALDGYPTIVDTTNGRVIGDTPGGGLHPGAIVRISPDRKSLFAASVGLTPCIINKYDVTTDNAQYVSSPAFGSIGDNFRDMAVDPDNTHLYVMCAYPYAAQRLLTTDWTLTNTLSTGAYPTAIRLVPEAQLAFTAQGFNDIKVFNTTTRVLLQTYFASETVLAIRALADVSKFYAITGDPYRNPHKLQAFNIPKWPINSKLTAVSSTPTNATLSWTPASETVSPLNYILTGGPNTVTVPGDILIYTFQGLTPDREYTFTIYVQNSEGHLSLLGPAATVRTPPDTDPPIWPPEANLAVTNLTPISLTLTWTPAMDNVGVTRYRVYANGTIAATPGVFTTVILTGLSPGTRYTFQVKAGDGADNWGADGPLASTQTPLMPPPGDLYRLDYKLRFEGDPYRGNTIVLLSNFTNRGTTRVNVTGIKMYSVFGVFTQGLGIPLSLQPGQRAELSTEANIPASAAPGSYHVTTRVFWQYLEPASNTWQFGQPNPITVDSVITILAKPQPPPQTPPTDSSGQTSNEQTSAKLIEKALQVLPIIGGAYAAVVIALATFFIRREHVRATRSYR